MLWVALLSSGLALHAPSLAANRARSPLCSASWAALDAPPTRESAIAALDGLKADGSAPLWNSFRLAPRAVGMRELSQTTQLAEKALDPYATEYETEDIRNAFVKVLLGATVASLAWALGSDALGMDAGMRFTGTYLIAGVPIGVLAIGSVAPGILFLPLEALKASAAKEDSRERVCRHEAAHLLTAHCLGVPIASVSVEAAGPRCVIFDEEAVQVAGSFVDSETTLPPLAVVAMSGFMAEAEAYGKAVGASADLKVLSEMMLRAKPPIPAQQQQGTTRWAALMAWTIQKKHPRAYEAVTAALIDGKGLAECLQAAEAAERA